MYFPTPESASETTGNRIMKTIMQLHCSQAKQLQRYPPLATANYQAGEISPHVIIMFFKLPHLEQLSSSKQYCFFTVVVSLVLLGDRRKVQ